MRLCLWAHMDMPIHTSWIHMQKSSNLMVKKVSNKTDVCIHPIWNSSKANHQASQISAGSFINTVLNSDMLHTIRKHKKKHDTKRFSSEKFFIFELLSVWKKTPTNYSSHSKQYILWSIEHKPNSVDRSVVSLWPSIIMTSSVKLFQFFQNIHQTIGICESQPNQQRWLKKLIYRIGLVSFVFSSFAFLIFEARSLFDYGFGSFSLITVVNSSILYVLFIWKSENILKSIGKCEEFIEKSKIFKMSYLFKISQLFLLLLFWIRSTFIDSV